MSILRAMYTGVSGVNAEGAALGVIGDNIANVNTYGFKQQRALFEDMLGRSLGARSDQAGAGVTLSVIQQLFKQGALANTGVPTDLALDGDGFFVVNGIVSGVGGNFYTRAGQLQLDKDGYLSTVSGGMRIQGYKAQANGTFSASVSSIQLPTAALSPSPTANISVTANLDSSAPQAAAWDITNPSTTSNFSTAITTYDTLGNPHAINVFFRKTGTNAWEFRALVAGPEVGQAPGNVQVGTGTLTFSPTGALQTVTGTTVPINAPNNFVGAGNQTINLSFGTAMTASPPGTGLDGVTQFSAPSNVSSQSQDGYASGGLAGIMVDSKGIVRGVYTNGQKVPAGQLAIAKFRSNEGLGRAGHNLWIDTPDSGVAALGTAGNGGRGAIQSGTVEQSNVDLAGQFVDLITHQRAFQANSKTISTADEMLQELVNLKR